MAELTGHIACRENGLAENEAAAECDERFAALVMRQSRFAFRVAYSVLRNVHDAEDAVQETFLKLYRTGTWRHMKDERAFLARTVWRIAVDRLPKRESPPANAVLTSNSVEEAVLSADWNSTIHRLMRARQILNQKLAALTVGRHGK